MKKEKLTENISFRLAESEFAPYKAVLAKSNIKRSKLFRDTFIAKSNAIALPKENTKTHQRLLFIASKTSNNINQIARKLNSAYRGGVISEKIFVESLNHLISIERNLSGAIEKC